MKNSLIAIETQLSCFQAALPISKEFDYKADCIAKMRGRITEILEKITLL
jgi:hypothetical protein